MKKTLIKGTVFVIIFIASLFIIGRVMNKDHNNLTMEMQAASLPVITMENSGMAYNELHGYKETMDTAFQRDTITVLGENRDAGFIVDTYGRDVTGIFVEVRNTDGSRLIENTEITDYQLIKNKITGRLALKDLIEKDEEYALVIIVELDGEEQVRYYTRAIWSDSLHAAEKLAFVKDFHEKLYDKEAAKELTKYLETNSSLEDNRSFHKVTIHSSFKQITWGDLPVREVMEPVIQLKEIASQTASVVVDYLVSTGSGRKTIYYQVEEYYRVRYTKDRMYLLDYERTMTQLPDVEKMYANDKILLGITDVNIPMLESEDGNVVVFEVGNCLCSYNVVTNKLTVVFCFYDEENMDARTLYGQHAIKILDVDEGGNIRFAVYGYMNRGRHEGEVGVQLYSYDHALNTIEESVYIPYHKSYAVLAPQMEQLLYLNREQKFYLSLENTIYGIDLVEKTYERLVDITQDDSIRVSENHKIMVWQEGSDMYHCTKLNALNLNNDTQIVIEVNPGEAIRPLGFMGEDIIYGVARQADIVEENTGRSFFPMYKVCIANSGGELLKEYRQDAIYITGCTVADNQITLERLERQEDGSYQSIEADHIMNNVQEQIGKNIIVAADIDTYERYVQIQTRSTIDSKTIKILTPKEVVFEGGRELVLEAEGEAEAAKYYVYGPYGVSGVYSAPAKAVNQAYETSGVVVDAGGNCIWIKGNRVTKNQIMAIKEPEICGEKESLAVCLDTMLRYEGLMSNAAYLLQQGQTVVEILEDNLEDVQVLDLTGCTLDAILYYVNQDIPVLAMLKNGESVLVTGFNEFNVVIMEPSTGKLYKKGMNDATEWFYQNGNCFITYVRTD